MHYVWDFAILTKYSHLFWLGLGFTIAYTVGTIFLGTVIGLFVGIMRLAACPSSTGCSSPISNCSAVHRCWCRSSGSITRFPS